MKERNDNIPFLATLRDFDYHFSHHVGADCDPRRLRRQNKLGAGYRRHNHADAVDIGDGVGSGRRLNEYVSCKYTVKLPNLEH